MEIFIQIASSSHTETTITNSLISNLVPIDLFFVTILTTMVYQFLKQSYK